MIDLYIVIHVILIWQQSFASFPLYWQVYVVREVKNI